VVLLLSFFIFVNNILSLYSLSLSLSHFFFFFLNLVLNLVCFFKKLWLNGDMTFRTNRYMWSNTSTTFNEEHVNVKVRDESLLRIDIYSGNKGADVFLGQVKYMYCIVEEEEEEEEEEEKMSLILLFFV
jgi:hypothetical protein